MPFLCGFHLGSISPNSWPVGQEDEGFAFVPNGHFGRSLHGIAHLCNHLLLLCCTSSCNYRKFLEQHTVVVVVVVGGGGGGLDLIDCG